MDADRSKLKIYTTTSFMPSGDVRALVGARREDYGSFRLYVVAPSKLKASLAVRDAYRGRSLASPEVLKVAAVNLDAPRGHELDAIARAGYLTEEGDVVTTDDFHQAAVVLVRAAADANGDPELVGRFEVAKDADDFPVRGFKRADGVVFAEPVDELLKRMTLEGRDKEKAEAAALANVRDFLAAHEVMATAPATTTDPDLVHSIGTNDRASGRIDLTIRDLRILLNLAEGRR